MADDPNEDTWLYGSSNPEPPGDENDDNADKTNESNDDGNESMENDRNPEVCVLQLDNLIIC